jgi:hypothetical protein
MNDKEYAIVKFLSCFMGIALMAGVVGLVYLAFTSIW